MSLTHDGPLSTTGDMPSTMPMNLQTATKQQLRRYAAGPHHVLLTLLNENPRQSLTCQRGPVVPHSPGNWQFLALNGACWHESPEFLLIVDSIPTRGIKRPLTCGFAVSNGCVEGTNHVLLMFLIEKLVTFWAYIGPI